MLPGKAWTSVSPLKHTNFRVTLPSFFLFFLVETGSPTAPVGLQLAMELKTT